MTEIVSGLQGDRPNGTLIGAPYVGGKDKVLACAKHFVGDGGTKDGIDQDDTTIDYRGLLGIHMPAYYDSIIKGVSTIMVSFSSLNGEKMHANHALITRFLKNTLKFHGFVTSDYGGVEKMMPPSGGNYTHCLEKAIQAGIDVVMGNYSHVDFLNNMTALVKSNAIPISRIDEAVWRILRVKFVAGLFENPLADNSMVSEIGSQAHRDLAREAVRKSLVLLKNGKEENKPVLPLPKNATRILVAGTHANNIGNQCGGWTGSWQGYSGNNITIGTTILNGISTKVDPRTEIIYSENPNAEFVKSLNASYGIVVVGEPPYAELLGDSLSLTIPSRNRYD